MLISVYLTNFTSSKNIDFSLRKLRLNDWFLVITKNDPFWTRIYKGKFSVIQKNEQKKWISPRKIGLQLRINTHSVDNFVAHNVKIKYFRVAFEWMVLFDRKPLKFDIKFTRDFMRKTFSKPTQIDSELKTEPKIFNTLVQLTMHFYE